MGARFTDADRERIRRSLLETGRKLFAAKGLSRTSLDDLVRPTGIAKTTFYLFFASKEALYLDLLALEAPGVDERVMAHLRDPGLPAADALRLFLTALLSEYETNSLVRRLVVHPDEMAAVARRVRPEDLERKASWATRPLLDFVATRQALGELVDADKQAVVGTLSSVALLALHKERFGPDYAATVELLIALVSRGLVERPIEVLRMSRTNQEIADGPE